MYNQLINTCPYNCLRSNMLVQLRGSKGIAVLVIHSATFVWLISRTFLANEPYFPLTINQPMILSAMVNQL